MVHIADAQFHEIVARPVTRWVRTEGLYAAARPNLKLDTVILPKKPTL